MPLKRLIGLYVEQQAVGGVIILVAAFVGGVVLLVYGEWAWGAGLIGATLAATGFAFMLSRKSPRNPRASRQAKARRHGRPTA